MAVLEHMSTQTDPKTLSYKQLVNLCSDGYIKPDYLNQCLHELAIRCLTGLTHLSGESEIKRFMDKWDGQNVDIAKQMLPVLEDSLKRCKRKPLGRLLREACKKVKEAL